MGGGFCGMTREITLSFGLLACLSTSCGGKSAPDAHGPDARADAIIIVPDQGKPADKGPGPSDQGVEAFDFAPADEALSDPALELETLDMALSDLPAEPEPEVGPEIQDIAPVDPMPEPEIPDQASDQGADPKTEATSDPGQDVPVGPKTGTCKWFYEVCAAQCPDPPTVLCLSNCFSQLSEDGKAQQTALEDCLSSNSCLALTGQAFEDCLEAHCLDQYFKCFAGDKYYTCVDLLRCLRDCPDGDTQCPQGCFDGASYLANWDWEKRIQCLWAQCPICKTASTKAEEEQCSSCANTAAFGACAVEFQRCEPAGNKRCGELWDCVQACNDDPCAYGCLDAATFVGKAKHQAVYACIDAQCPGLVGQAWLDCANNTINGSGPCVPALQTCLNDQEGCTTHCAPVNGCGADGCGGTCGLCGPGTDCDGKTATCIPH